MVTRARDPHTPATGPRWHETLAGKAVVERLRRRAAAEGLTLSAFAARHRSERGWGCQRTAALLEDWAAALREPAPPSGAS